MNNYELLFILPGTLTEEETLPLVEKVKGIITEAGGEDLGLKDLKKNRLAYPIRHIRYGYFYILRFQAESNMIEEANKKLGVTTELLRALIQKSDPKKQANLDHFTTAEKAQAPREMERPRQRDTILDNVPVSKKPKEKKEEKPKKKVSLEEIGEELDKILDSDIDL